MLAVICLALFVLSMAATVAAHAAMYVSVLLAAFVTGCTVVMVGMALWTVLPFFYRKAFKRG
jgi:hypothetical protein